MLPKLEKPELPPGCVNLAKPDAPPDAVENGFAGGWEGCEGAPHGEGLLPSPPDAPNPVLPAVPIAEGAPNAGCAGFPRAEVDPKPVPPAVPIAEGAPNAGAAGFPRVELVDPKPGVPKPGGVGFIKAGVGVPNPVLPIWGAPGAPNVAAGLLKTLLAPFDDGVLEGCPKTDPDCAEADEGGFGEDSATVLPDDAMGPASSLPKTRPGYRVPA